MNDIVYTGKELLENMTFATNYNQFLANLILPFINENNRVLDFGAGIGTFVDMLSIKKKENVSFECFEVDKSQIEILNKKGYQICYSNIGQLPEKRFDVIYSLNVIEHIEDDMATLRALKSALNPNGVLLIYVPAIQALYTEFDYKIGHYRRYHKKTLRKMLQLSGYKTEKIIYQDFLGFFVGFLYRLLKGKSGKVSSKQILFYDSIIFPFSRIFDRLFFGLIGKNLYAVCRPADTRFETHEQR